MTLLHDEDDFGINRFALEDEAERNASLMRKYGKLLANAVAIVKDEKRKLEFIETEQAEIIRSNTSSYGLKNKPSDRVVFGLVKNEPEYIAQFNRYLQAVRKEEDYKSAVDVCKQRGMMIRVLTEQWLNNYYSKPVVYDHQMPGKHKQLPHKRFKLSSNDPNEGDNGNDY